MKFLFIVTLLLALLAPARPTFAGEITFCFGFDVKFDDVGIGEDYHARYGVNRWRARGMLVDIVPFPQGPHTPDAFDGHADPGTGCVDINTNSPAGSQHRFHISMYPEARLSTGAQQAELLVKVEDEGGVELGPWNFDTGFIEAGDPDIVGFSRKYYPTAHPDRFARLMAVGNHAMYRWLRDGADLGDEDTTLVLEWGPCSRDPENEYSCASRSRVYIHSSGNRKKFLIAHEIGHWVDQRLWGGGLGDECKLRPEEVDQTETEEDCLFHGTNDSTTHALQMKVPNACALNEGFGHFFATAVFNDPHEEAFFHYYKDTYPKCVRLEDGSDDLEGGVTAYMEQTCNGEDEGWGTELDWMRTFWDYYTDSGTKPTHASFLAHIHAARAERNGDEDLTTEERQFHSYEYMINNDVTSSAEEARFAADADENGADH